MENYELKIGRRIFNVNNTDLILDNGACYILLTKKYFDNYSQVSPTVPKTTIKKLMKFGALEKTDKKYIGWNGKPCENMTIYRFNIEALKGVNL